MSTIQVEHVYKVFGRDPHGAVERLRGGDDAQTVKDDTGAVAAVIDASFEVRSGEIFVVMGLSGSGKSTLVRTINRLFEPTEGRIAIDGVEVTELDAKQLREFRAEKAAMVFQHFGLLPHRTVLGNTEWGLQVQHVPREEREQRARQALDVVGLSGWEDSYPDQLSGGMQQRVGLARALATDPDILLMDEAFSALDPLIRREMQEQLLELQERLHKTIVFITHDLNEAMLLGDRIAMLRAGRIVQIGTTEEILTDPATDYVASFIQDVDRSRVLTAATVMERPQAVISEKEGPRAALKVMRELQRSAVFVVGAEHRLRGIVTDDAAMRATRHDVDSVDELLEKTPTVVPDVPLNELFTPSAESLVPLAVVDDSHRLVGVVPRVTLLAALGNGTRRTSAAPEGEVTSPDA